MPARSRVTASEGGTPNSVSTLGFAVSTLPSRSTLKMASRTSRRSPTDAGLPLGEPQLLLVGRAIAAAKHADVDLLALTGSCGAEREIEIDGGPRPALALHLRRDFADRSLHAKERVDMGEIEHPSGDGEKVHQLEFPTTSSVAYPQRESICAFALRMTPSPSSTARPQDACSKARASSAGSKSGRAFKILTHR